MADMENKPNNDSDDYRQWHPGLRQFWSLMVVGAERRLAKERAGKDHRGDRVSD